MAVISASETWQGRNGSFENFVDNDTSRTWLVKTNNKWDDSHVVASYFKTVLGIEFLTPHPNNSFFTARKMQVDQKDETPYAWDVTVDYSTSPLGESEQYQEFENPLNVPTVIMWRSEFVRRFTVFDKEGDPMVNSAKFPFEAHEQDHVRWSIQLRKNLQSVPSWVASYVNKVNSTAVTIGGLSLQPRTLKMSGLSISEQKELNNIPYYEVSTDLSYDPENWDVKQVNSGFYDINGERIKDENNEPCEEPWPLTEAGARLAIADFDDITVLTFRVYQEADFNQLPLS